MPRTPKADMTLDVFHPAVREWFAASFAFADEGPATGLAGHRQRGLDADHGAHRSGKTLTAFLWALDRLMFTPAPAERAPLPGASMSHR